MLPSIWPALTSWPSRNEHPLQTFFAVAGKLAILVHFIKRLDEFILLDEIGHHVAEHPIRLARVWRLMQSIWVQPSKLFGRI
jgi:hypothetical protein